MAAEHAPPEGAQATANNPENASTAAIKREEIVCILRPPTETGGEYLIYALSEGSTSDDGKPFSLRVVPTGQLPDDLSAFLLDQDAVPPSHLRLPHQVHVVVSTHSGLRRAPDFFENVLRPLLGALGLKQGDGDGAGYRVTVTQDANTVRNLARELARDVHAGEKTVVLLSGDGGVVDLLNGLDRAAAAAPSPSPSASSSSTAAPPTIALLPLGTGNALFHSLHKPQYAGTNPPSPLVLALRTFLAGRPAPLPVFRASFSPGARLVGSNTPPPGPEAPAPNPAEAQQQPGQREQPEQPAPTPHHRDGDEDENEAAVPHLLGAIVASYGFHASLVWESDTPAYRAHGARRFGMAAAALLEEAHGYRARVERFGYVLATLVSSLEQTFTISPASRPLDGRLRLVHFGAVGGARTMEIMTAAYRDGAHVGMDEVGYEEVDEVRVTVDEEAPRWRKMCVDGTIVEVERGGWMSVRREGRVWLRVLVDGVHVR
ncbi:39421102-03cc-4e9a-af22-90d4ea619ff5 [Thermothielavioides terrestris]|uniref:39421102-03cc-4e9a-af22-90d4ea619ff5 n=1 Tax=Thermothielavioides terrestris TaxID=2587410 RepID=A0A3S4ASY7_9PEZI|nr:39421102-03cc-4e9a-af22-90d4ea619ff5 [Thermothielavioides terrestris]